MANMHAAATSPPLLADKPPALLSRSLSLSLYIYIYTYTYSYT